MAIPVPYAFSGASRLSLGASAPVVLVAIALCGCSFDLGSWSSAPEKETVPKAAPAEAGVSDAQAATKRGQALVRSGKTEEARAEFDQAIAIDPYNAQALYSPAACSVRANSNISLLSTISPRRLSRSHNR